jgi:hypothetical protein
LRLLATSANDANNGPDTRTRSRGAFFFFSQPRMIASTTRGYGKEKLVSIFKRDDDDVGTPFVEIDPDVVAYVESCGDKCVKEMFKRMTKSDGAMTAMFPFARLGHSFSAPKRCRITLTPPITFGNGF